MMLPALVAAVSLAVQPDSGSLSLSLDKQPIVTGVLSQYPLQVATTAVRQDAPARYTVNVTYTDHSSAIYSYALDGNDCTLEYTLTNAADKPQIIGLSGWKCAFAPGAPLKGTNASLALDLLHEPSGLAPRAAKSAGRGLCSGRAYGGRFLFTQRVRASEPH